LSFLTDIRGQVNRALARCSDLFRYLLRSFTVSINDGHICSLSGKQQGDCPADSLRASSYNTYLSSEFWHDEFVLNYAVN
jgi:hypothetical protein